MQNGATFAPGKVGQAFSFNGTGDYVSLPASSVYPSGNSPRTVDMWVYTRNLSSWASEHTIFEYGAEPGLRTAFGIDMDGYQMIQFYAWGDDLDHISTGPKPPTGWMHIAVTYDGLNLRVYTDGVLRASRTYPTGLNTTPSDDAVIGRSNNLFTCCGVANTSFIGLIDEVEIFNRALSASEIQAIFQAGSAGRCANLPPQITGATLTQQQGSPASTQQIATVSDPDQASNSLTVAVTPLTGMGVTVGAAAVDSAGNVTASVQADCTATNSTFQVKVTDLNGAMATSMLTVNVTTNTPPVLSYNNANTLAGQATTVNPATGPTDNGSIATIVVQNVTPSPAPGAITVNNSTGVVSVPNNVSAGTYTVTIRATDNCGGANGVTDATFTLTVGCVNALTVNNTGDGADFAPGNGICETAVGNGQCTLRAAIGEANALMGCSPLTITITATGTIMLGSALPTLNHPNLTINGPGANQLEVRRNSASNFRIFRVGGASTVTFRGLTMSNGMDGDGNFCSGLLNDGTATLLGCVLRDNGTSATTGATLRNNRTMTIQDCTIGPNNAADNPIVANSNGGGLLLVNTTISGNNSDTIVSMSAAESVTMLNCTITGNTGPGGNAIVLGAGAPARFRLKNNIIAGNGGAGGSSRDVLGPFLSLGHNFIGQGNSATGLTNGVNGDQVGTAANPLNALLASLGDYSGPTPTHALLPGSPALNTGGVLPEIQRLRIGNTPGGTFTLTFNGQTTSSLPRTADENQIQSALNNLSSIGGAGGSVHVQSGGGFYFTVVFGGALATSNQPQLSATGTNLTVDVETLFEGGASLSADQRGIARPQQTTTDIGAFESRGFTLALNGGTPQTTLINTAFPMALGVSITSANNEPVNGGQITFMAPSSGASATLATNPVTIASGTASTNATANGMVGGPYNVTANGAASAVNFSLTNNVAPTVVSINPASTNPTNATSVQFTVTFSESVTGVTASNFMPTASGVTSAMVTGVTGSGTTWTVTVNTGSGDGTLRLDMINSLGVTDNGGAALSNTPFTSGQAYTIDKTAPTVAFSSAAPNPTNISPIPVTVTFSESVTGFTAADISTGNGTVNNFAGSGAVYTFDFVPAGQGLVTANIVANVAQDAVGNGNTAATQFSRTYDSVAPMVTVNQASGQADPISASPINFTVVFNETVTGFGDSAADVTLSGTAGATTAAVTGGPTTYNVAVSGMTTNGTVIVSIPAGAAQDSATNPSAPSTSTDNTVTFISNTQPTFTPAAALSRQQGSPAGAAVLVGTVADTQTAVSGLTVTQIAGGTATGISVTSITKDNTTGVVIAQVSAGCTATSGTVRFQVSDGSLTNTGDLQVNVTANTAPTLSYAPLHAIHAGQALTINAASGPSDNVSVNTVAFFNLPAALNGHISVNSAGVVTVANTAPAGNYTVTVRASDNCTTPTDASFTLNVLATCPTIDVLPKPTGVSPTAAFALPGGTQGQAYNQQFTASSAQLGTTYSYAVIAAPNLLPAGLNLNLNTGMVTGTPTVTGNFVFRIQATGFGDCKGTRLYSLKINAAARFAAQKAVSHDFDGDGKSDLFSYEAGRWTIIQSSDGRTVEDDFGAADEQAAAADYDGDGRADLAVWQAASGRWLIRQSSDGAVVKERLGQIGDAPAPADYDGDGRADCAVWQSAMGSWLLKQSSDATEQTFQLGAPGDLAVAGDYDGDGLTDLAVFRPAAGLWLWRRSSDGLVNEAHFGAAGDAPVAADYDGDGQTDLAVWRQDGYGYVLRSSDGATQRLNWGWLQPGEAALTGDYEGEGKAKLAIWRALEKTWLIRREQ